MPIHIYGDSHIVCFDKIADIHVHSYPGSSATGLGNTQSISNTNQVIRGIYDGTTDPIHIFHFGKVDIEFILNHKYNKGVELFEPLIEEFVTKYMSFVCSLDKTNKQCIVFGITYPHLESTYMLEALHVPIHHVYINKYLQSDSYTPIRYTKVLPYSKLLEYTIYFNILLKKQCALHGILYYDINTQFFQDTSCIISQYRKTNQKDHHLDESRLITLWNPILDQIRSQSL